MVMTRSYRWVAYRPAPLRVLPHQEGQGARPRALKPLMAWELRITLYRRCRRKARYLIKPVGKWPQDNPPEATSFLAMWPNCYTAVRLYVIFLCRRNFPAYALQNAQCDAA